MVRYNSNSSYSSNNISKQRNFITHKHKDMDYTTVTLFGLGLLGILIHNLKKMNDINKRNKGNLNFKEYLGLEMFSILLSVCLVIVALIAQQEIKQLESIGKWLGLSFVALGYMAQSIVISFAGRAENFLKNKE